MLKLLYGHVFSVPMGTYPGVELPDHMVNSMFNILRNC